MNGLSWGVKMTKKALSYLNKRELSSFGFITRILEIDKSSSRSCGTVILVILLRDWVLVERKIWYSWKPNPPWHRCHKDRPGENKKRQSFLARVYLCPHYPKICAHLAFAGHIIANPLILNRQTQLFKDGSRNKHFNMIFLDIGSQQPHRLWRVCAA